MRGRRLLLVLSLLITASCQSPPPASSVGPPEVKGRVKDADGNRIGRVAVKFHPTDEKNKGMSLTCMTQTDGTFSGRCAAGHYKITVLAVPAMPTDVPEKGKEKVAPPAPSLPPGVPKRYGSVEETPWEVDVPAQGKSGIVLKVEGS
jgi:hypothetical protein